MCWCWAKVFDVVSAPEADCGAFMSASLQVDTDLPAANEAASLVCVGVTRLVGGVPLKWGMNQPCSTGMYHQLRGFCL